MNLSSVKAFFTTPFFNYGRALLYVAIPAWLYQLVTDGRLSQDRADLVIAVVLAAIGPALAAVFAPNGWRTWLFGLATPIQGLLVGIGGISHNALGMLVIALLGAFITSGFAAANVRRTETTTPDTGAVVATNQNAKLRNWDGDITNPDA
ncbi:hypothetical protein [Mycobacterium sp. TY815]|uniref:phage holin n=1 Tax=Mycobacterium sp. TY815 TaxID=3050581 RepID=UPI0027410601|nr:hypothetical protein [Mycobacterium sp. TY815]MDP7703166.1 hypothetical protein [Mycobacterium sp. TY815]